MPPSEAPKYTMPPDTAGEDAIWHWQTCKAGHINCPVLALSANNLPFQEPTKTTLRPLTVATAGEVLITAPVWKLHRSWRWLTLPEFMPNSELIPEFWKSRLYLGQSSARRARENKNATLMQAFMAVIMATPVYRHVEQLAVKEL
jgi:hypothetical protein